VAQAAAHLKNLRAVLAERRAPEPPDRLAGAVGAYSADLHSVRRQGLTRSLSVDEAGRLFGMGFALDELRRVFDGLAERAREVAAGHGQDMEG
jgi:hypothetical protein